MIYEKAAPDVMRGGSPSGMQRRGFAIGEFQA
jgi:hypothetical protein